MWKTIQTVARRIFEGCIVFVGGGIIVLFLLLLGLPLLHNSAVDVTRSDSQDLARSVLSSCNLGKSRLKKLHRGYKTMPSFHGDHFGAYAMELSHVDVSVLTPERGWTRGDQVSGSLENAIRNVLSMTKNERVKWFPNEQEVKSADMFVYALPWKTFSLLLIRPSDRMVFYAYFET